MSSPTWNLQLLIDQGARLPKLQCSLPFEQIAQDIAARMTVLCCHCSAIKGTSFSRVAYCIQVDSDLFDSFFNSETGYRAAYYRSPYEGMRANAVFMQAVSLNLIDSGVSVNCGLTSEFIHESLATCSAKVWLTEAGKEVCLSCAACKGEWSVGSGGHLTKPEIANGRWELASQVKANWGSKAPYLTKLRVLGAFLDDRLNEFIPFDKRFRAREIHELGWS